MGGIMGGMPYIGGPVGAIAQATALGVPQSVRAYGAVGNGTTDDTSAIQAALTAAGNAGGGVVIVPYTESGYLCGALTLPPGVAFTFERGAKLVAPSTLAASWVVAEASKIHNGTAVIGGTFDASNTTSSSVTAVIDFSSVTSCPNTRIIDTRIINAPIHGVFLSESTYTAEAKWVQDNSIDGHGTAATGYGIYCDYIGNVHIEDNFVTTTGTDDSIELGHSGPEYLGGLDARLLCIHNHCVNGEINFPHSHYALIDGNTVVGNTIQNDANAANNVTITNNTVINPNPAAGYAGICVNGDRALIEGNTIELNGAGVGILGDTQPSSNTVIRGNVVRNTSSTAATLGIGAGGSTSDTVYSASNIVEGNQVVGAFTDGIDITGSNHLVRGNMLALTGATYGICLLDSSVTGNTPQNNRLQGNSIAGAATAVQVNDASGTVALDNIGYNPQAWATTTPALPTGTGSANYIQNTNPYPVLISQAGASGTNIEDTAGVGKELPADPVDVRLDPGERISYITTVPTAWLWRGL